MAELGGWLPLTSGIALELPGFLVLAFPGICHLESRKLTVLGRGVFEQVLGFSEAGVRFLLFSSLIPVLPWALVLRGRPAPGQSFVPGSGHPKGLGFHLATLSAELTLDHDPGSLAP